jgi:hypothetical protein
MLALSLTQKLSKLRNLQPNGCWKPNRYIEPHGYSRLMIAGKWHYLHILSYRAFVGEIPPNKQLDHICRNRWCFNFEHLEPVTSLENSLRGEHPNFVSHITGVCRRGHIVDEANGIKRQDGRLRCRTCHNERRRKK